MGTGCIASGMGIISGCCTETSSLGSREGGSPVGGELQHRLKGIQGRVGDLGHTLEMGPSRYQQAVWNEGCGEINCDFNYSPVHLTILNNITLKNI